MLVMGDLLDQVAQSEGAESGVQVLQVESCEEVVVEVSTNVAIEQDADDCQVS